VRDLSFFVVAMFFVWLVVLAMSLFDHAEPAGQAKAVQFVCNDSGCVKYEVAAARDR
jgi:hypothetical protein